MWTVTLLDSRQIGSADGQRQPQHFGRRRARWCLAHIHHVGHDQRAEKSRLGDQKADHPDANAVRRAEVHARASTTRCLASTQCEWWRLALRSWRHVAVWSFVIPIGIVRVF